MSDVTRYSPAIADGHGWEIGDAVPTMVEDPEGEWAAANEIERLTAERDDLQVERNLLAKCLFQAQEAAKDLAAQLTAERDQWERHAGQYMDERDRLAERAERLEHALWYALNQHEQPLRFSAGANHWSALAREALAQEKRDE